MKLLQEINHCVRVVSPNCEHSAFLLSQRREEKLPRLTEFFLHLHLILCRHCRKYDQHLAFIAAACSQYPGHPDDTTTPKLSPEARERLQKRMQLLIETEREEPL